MMNTPRDPPEYNEWEEEAPFQRKALPAPHPGKAKQHGAFRRFDKMFGSQPSTTSAAMSLGSQVDGTPASQSPVSPQYSPASQPTSSQLEPVLDRRPRKRKGIKSSA